ncbi:hypothetical protein B0T24DRAFT_230306 [Lasiosphaeria ovina]|uniref:Uncharacterized protein n=1 Tax=Lasiosphaeria ovina TaxID=92902 RepID=A0AAE0NB62_9PEZI|nr:hypothetical protein B0T24DRAFT_230306 [Lasiosphaeria ovina]
MYVDPSAIGLMARDGAAAAIDCRSDFATDYYGLGVRLGVYFAWGASWIANTIVPSEFRPAADTSTIFLLALLIAMANDSMTRALSNLDGLILMHLCGGTVFGVLSLWGYRTRLYLNQGPRAVRAFGGFGTHIRLVLSLGVSIFGLWFWLYGVNGTLSSLGPDDGSEPPNSPECEVLYTFFFAKVRAAGGIRIYYIVVCVSCTVWFSIMFLVSSLAGLASFSNIRGLVQFNRWTSLNRAKYATGFNHKELKLMFKSLRVLNLFWLLFSAITVEITLNFNHVHNVLGGGDNGAGGLNLPSQLLPFLTGLFSFIRICYALFKEKWGGEKETTTATTATPSNDSLDNKEARGILAHPGSGATGPSDEVVEAVVLVSPRSVSFPQNQMASPLSPGFGGNVPGLPRADSYHIIARSLLVRYLVGFLPWLGIVVHPHTTKSSVISHVVSRGTGLSGVHNATIDETIVMPVKRDAES